MVRGRSLERVILKGIQFLTKQNWPFGDSFLGALSGSEPNAFIDRPETRKEKRGSSHVLGVSG